MTSTKESTKRDVITKSKCHIFTILKCHIMFFGEVTILKV